jgi:hypothetical protein
LKQEEEMQGKQAVIQEQEHQMVKDQEKEE